MIVHVYLCLASRACNCGGTQNCAIISAQDLGKVEGQIAYSDFIIKRSEHLLIDTGAALPLDHIRLAGKLDYNHPRLALTTVQGTQLFSTQLNTLPTIRNGSYQIVHR